MWNRVELKEDSRALLRLNYWPFVLVAFIHAVAAGSGIRSNGGTNFIRRWNDNGYYGYGDYDEFLYDTVSFLLPFFGFAMILILGAWAVMLLLDIFVLNPLEVGCKRYMTIAREVKPQFGEMAFAFKNCYVNIVQTMFLRSLFIFLWSLLFVIPGIIKAYEYRMVPYLMAEYPDMASQEAFRISREMMTGNKAEAFVLDLSFIGWNILSMVTFGLAGLFYAAPYQMLTDSALYLVLKRTNPSLGYAKPDDNYYL